MMLSDLVLGIFFLIQLGVGLLGNFFLLGLHSFTLLTSQRLRPIEYIFAHLALANAEALLSKGIPHTIACFGLKNFLDRVGCKFIIFLQNVARSVSLSITCLLSGFQVITISPSHSRWAELKIQAQKYIVPSCFLCWCFYLLINFTLIGSMHNSGYLTNNTKIWNLRYCSSLTPDSFNAALFVLVFSIPDVMCMGFMIWASAYLVLLLHRHHQQVKHIHNPYLSSRIFPEKRATHAVLLLVSTYVSFYSINSSLSFYFFQMEKHESWFVATLDLLGTWFPAMSPFVLIFSDSQILKSWHALWHRKCLLLSPMPQCPQPYPPPSILSQHCDKQISFRRWWYRGKVTGI
ncbi:vomeronasal type-1 receptor 3-like [Trichosurus vulpecula]|uniref:vomeronasal type-1 receptor 3-like n=1 Tax=Trichosurus vulpecula TaxID=9337 RepID=UPI00186AC30C|nr:vomeronasal type-1 receptor 3-like [Trichosurus vulpecula]